MGFIRITDSTGKVVAEPTEDEAAEWDLVWREKFEAWNYSPEPPFDSEEEDKDEPQEDEDEE